MTLARRGLAALTGVAYGLGLGPLVAYGEVLILAWVLAVGLVLWGFLALFPEARRRAHAIVLLAYGVHLAAVSLLYFGSLAMGLGGFFTGDDAAYSDLAWKVARIWGGEAVEIGSESYLLGTFVYLQSALYALFGERPLLMLVLNAGLGTALGVLAFEIARHLSGARAAVVALVLVSFFPSLVLWSVLNLKEALTLFLIAVVLWALLRFQMRGRWPYLGIAFLTLLPLQTLRSYIFLELAVIVVIAVAIAPGWRWPRRATATALAAALSGLLIITAPGGAVQLGPDPVSFLERIRFSMGVGARTSFQDTIPAREGETFVVPPPTSSPRVVNVSAGSRLVVLAPDETPPPSVPPGFVFVRPGDVVVVGPATPAPPSARRPLQVEPGSGPLTIEDTGQRPGLFRLVTYLPRGVAYVLFAPFPWDIDSGRDLLVLPEMVLWYLLAGAALATIWAHRARWRFLLPLLVFIAGTIGILALAEGNVGTLFRHRGMVIPFVAILASPSLVRLGDLLLGYRLGPGPRSADNAAARMAS